MTAKTGAIGPINRDSDRELLELAARALEQDENFLFVAAICRDKFEGGNGTRYFGSMMAYNSHQSDAVSFGLLNDDFSLTPIGSRIGEACSSIPNGRATAFGSEYRRVAAEVITRAAASIGEKS